MRIRIDIEFKESGTIVRIAGRLTEPSTEQLRKACEPIEGDFVLDLSNLMFADTEGINAIRAVCDTGAGIKGASPFIRLLLDEKS
jgi:anti-anti-sigma regulatory factor